MKTQKRPDSELSTVPESSQINEAGSLSDEVKQAIDRGEVKLIPLTRGRAAIIDAQDFERISRFKWSLGGSGRYAVRRERGRMILMHVEIMGDNPGFEIDHRNSTGTDNRRTNLRWATHGQNCANRSIGSRPSKYGFLGVEKHGCSWRGYVSCAKKRVQTEPCNSAELAALQRDNLAWELHGDFGVFNFERPELPQGKTRLWKTGVQS